MTNIEQQALELLAAEYERDGMRAIAADIRMRGAITHQENIVCRAIVRALSAPVQNTPAKFKLGDHVTKIKGSQWTGRVVGTYSTKLTLEGYAVESATETGSVQIYPAAALTLADRVSAPGNDGVVIRDYIVLRPDGIQYRTDASGAAMATKREGFRVYAEVDSSPPAAQEVVRLRHSCETDMLSPCPACNADAGYTNPTPAARVSGQDIDRCEDIAKWIDEGDKHVLDSTDAAAIRRLVQAVKGEKL